MNTRIDPQIFRRIMTLPRDIRMDLLEFAASAVVDNAQLNNILLSLLKSQNPKQDPGHA